MSSALFIRRPIGTLLVAIGIALAGLLAYRQLPIAPLPNVDIPTIVVFAARPGAEPAVMASGVAAPLERQLGSIPGLDEMMSISATGASTIVLQFSTARDLDAAALDVQSAINAAATDLPIDLPARPFFRKYNPADTPVLTIALTSDARPLSVVHDIADGGLSQALSQVPGVSQVDVNGADVPAVRVQLNPQALARTGLTGQDVDMALRAANALGPVGGFEGPDRAETIGINGQLTVARDYLGLLLKSSRGAVVTLGDVAQVIDSTADVRLGAWSGDQPAVLLAVRKAAEANVIETTDRIKAVLPVLQARLPPDITLTVLADRTTTIRAGIADARTTLLLTLALVLLVVLVSTRRAAPVIAAAATVILTLAGTFVAMWFQGFALDNFSIMALTVAIGFVVDDAIVVIEAIVRRTERSDPPVQAAITGVRHVGFTIVSISASLVAVFIPLLFMGGIVGRLLHEFATTLTIAIALSAILSLTLAPMLCARLARPATARPPSALARALEHAGSFTARRYGRALGWTLQRPRLMIGTTIAAFVATIALYAVAPKGLLPTQDTGVIEGRTIADPSVSFEAMRARQQAVVATLLRDPAIATISSQIGVVNGFTPLNRGGLTIGLRPRGERDVTPQQVIARLRPALDAIGGIQTVLDPAQDLPSGTRPGGGIQLVLLDADLDQLRLWTDRLERLLGTVPGLLQVSSDQDAAGPAAHIVIDRAAAARLGVSVKTIDDALDTAFTQHQSVTLYGERDHHNVILEIDPALQSGPAALDSIFVADATGRQIPLGSVARVEPRSALLAVRHQNQLPASTISFDPAPGTAASTAIERALQAAASLNMPASIRIEFAGNAKFLVESLSTQPILIGAALLSIYMILGALYESVRQPLTILSTLPSAGLGALLALALTGTDLSIVAIVGILLLMGLAKKNGIILVDAALHLERTQGLAPQAAIHAACLERFRPIMMTTFAALLGALPLALSTGIGAELRQPLGIAITGGLLISQTLTLFTTPAIYLALRPRRTRPSHFTMLGHTGQAD